MVSPCNQIDTEANNGFYYCRYHTRITYIVSNSISWGIGDRMSRQYYERGGSRGAMSEREASGGRPCPRCETPMYHRHCKYVCPNHGVVYDCSDTFY